MDEMKLTVERRGHVLLMGFNRPQKRNAFDVDTYKALAAAYGELDRDPELRCGVVFGHGEHFTAGLDLPQWAPVLAEGRPVPLPEGSLDPFGLDESRRCRKPVVVAAQGVSFTVAVELMDAVAAGHDGHRGHARGCAGLHTTPPGRVHRTMKQRIVRTDG